jgi:hypothetical protein
LLEPGEIEDLAIPRITGIVSDGVSIGENAIALVDFTGRPNPIKKLLENLLPRCERFHQPSPIAAHFASR